MREPASMSEAFQKATRNRTCPPRQGQLQKHSYPGMSEQWKQERVEAYRQYNLEARRKAAEIPDWMI
jgi:hypothetical protein